MNSTVLSLYDEILFRTPTEDEAAYWAHQLEMGATVDELRNEFYRSNEAEALYGSLLPVTFLYQAALGRAPDADGLAYWANELTSGRLTFDDLVSLFAASPEFRELHPSIGTEVSSEELASLFYQNLLGRVPDAEGLAYWSEMLGSGAISSVQLITAFAASPEFTEHGGSALRQFLADYRTDGDLDDEHGSFVGNAPQEPAEPEEPTEPESPTGHEPEGPDHHEPEEPTEPESPTGHEPEGPDHHEPEEPEQPGAQVTNDTADAREAGIRTGNDASGDVLANDADAERVTAVQGQAHLVGQEVLGNYGTFRLQEDGTFLYEVDQENLTVDALRTGQSLSESFSYSAQNREYYEATATVKITIHGSDERVQRISPAGDGTSGAGVSRNPFIAGSGDYVAFTSSDTNVVPDRESSGTNPFVWNRNGETIGITKDGEFVGGNVVALSKNGLVAFQTALSVVDADEDSEGDTYLFDVHTGSVSLVERASHANSIYLSDNGRFLAMESPEPVNAGDINGAADIYVIDRGNTPESDDDVIERISIGLDGSQADGAHSRDPFLTGDGRYVAFHSAAGNFVYEGNGETDVFLFDRQEDRFEIISVSSDGVAGNRTSTNASISDDARYVVFESGANNLVEGDTNGEWDVFLRDRQAGQTIRISVGPDGAQASGGPSAGGMISADGRFVVFESDASNLVAGDTNGERDLFVYTVATGQVSRVVEGNSNYGTDYFRADISADGRYISFQSENQLTPGDHDTQPDVHVVDGTGWWYI